MNDKIFTALVDERFTSKMDVIEIVGGYNIELPHGMNVIQAKTRKTQPLRSSKKSVHETAQKTNLSEIFDYLKKKNKTNVVFVDLSCEVVETAEVENFNERSERRQSRVLAKPSSKSAPNKAKKAPPPSNKKASISGV